MTGRGPRYTGPDLLEPLLMVFCGDQAKDARRNVGRAIPSGFALHEYKFNIVFDNRIRFIGLAQETRAILDFIGGIRNLMPDNRSQIVESQLAAVLLN